MINAEFSVKQEKNPNKPKPTKPHFPPKNSPSLCLL